MAITCDYLFHVVIFPNFHGVQLQIDQLYVLSINLLQIKQ